MCNNTDLLSIIGIAKTVLRVLQIGIPIILLIVLFLFNKRFLFVNFVSIFTSIPP